jgi:hypothetical protein
MNRKPNRYNAARDPYDAAQRNPTRKTVKKPRPFTVAQVIPYMVAALAVAYVIGKFIGA